MAVTRSQTGSLPKNPLILYSSEFSDAERSKRRGNKVTKKPKLHREDKSSAPSPDSRSFSIVSAMSQTNRSLTPQLLFDRNTGHETQVSDKRIDGMKSVGSQSARPPPNPFLAARKTSRESQTSSKSTQGEQSNGLIGEKISPETTMVVQSATVVRSTWPSLPGLLPAEILKEIHSSADSIVPQPSVEGEPVDEDDVVDDESVVETPDSP